MKSPHSRTETASSSLSTLQELCAFVDGQAKALAAAFETQMQCRKGCAGCCRNTRFRISPLEAAALWIGFQEVPAEVQTAILANLASGSGDCPLLVDDACALYAHRPVLCRAFGLILKSGEEIGVCELNFQNPPPDPPLKMLDLNPIYAVLGDLNRQALSQPEGLEKRSIREFLMELTGLDPG